MPSRFACSDNAQSTKLMVRIINFVLCNYNQGGLSAPLARYNGEFLHDASFECEQLSKLLSEIVNTVCDSAVAPVHTSVRQAMSFPFTVLLLLWDVSVVISEASWRRHLQPICISFLG